MLLKTIICRNGGLLPKRTNTGAMQRCFSKHAAYRQQIDANQLDNGIYSCSVNGSLERNRDDYIPIF